MNWNRLPFAGLLTLALFIPACSEDVGACQGALQGRDTVLLNNTVVYGGQAIINKACTSGCHSSKATGKDRHGVPAGLDFDLIPIDEEDAAGTKKSGGATIVKLKSSQIAGLRARQKKIVEQRNLIWQQVEDGLMPPSGMFDSVMSNIFASSEKTPCEEGKEFTKIPLPQTREVLRNWLACGAPLVETNGLKIDKVRVAGAAGYQYPTCKRKADAVVTLESLFKTTFSGCGGCHDGGPFASPPLFVSVDALAKSLRTKSACSGKRFISPGKPEDSYLLELLQGPNPDCGHEQMPKGDPLSERAIAEVSAWITAGAPTSAADLDEPPDASEEEPMSEDVPPVEPSDEDKDASVAPAVGKDAGRDAGNEAGRDAGKDAGRDAGRQGS